LQRVLNCFLNSISLQKPSGFHRRYNLDDSDSILPGVWEGVLALLTFKLLDFGLDLELEELRLD